MNITTLDRFDCLETIASLARAVAATLEYLFERHSKCFVVVCNQNPMFHKFLFAVTLMPSH
jgi:hypothetical protein